jgi:hypothetical protein
MDVRDINSPQGVISARNLYPGHVVQMEECMTTRGENFPQKTIFLALGNVSNIFVFVCRWTLNINI